MFNHNWLFWPAALLVWLLICERNLGISGQSQNAIGAHRDFQKTSFSCAGRPAGYYADIETGCQVYHMCDGLGRQFSYSCPNTTLFQQRMLVCDHWYMVNCSKAESDYAANLLIGQRDKPFVNDEENSLRTPRPDLLDRPYAPDYSGESFRNQYKSLPAAQNRIEDSDSQKQHDKTVQHIPPAGHQRWKIPSPSRLILPPAYEPQVELDPRTSNTASASNKQQSVIKHSFSSLPTSAVPSATTKFRLSTTTTTTTTRRPAPTPAPSVRPQFNGFGSAALHQRQEEHDDLGTSHSTRYNTSADFNSSELPSKNAPKSIFSSTISTKLPSKSPIKVPSKFYEPPFVYPIYNENDTLSRATETPLRVSSAAPFTAPTTRRTTITTTKTTTTRPFTRPTTFAGKPFTATFATPTTAAVSVSADVFKRTQKQQNSERFDIQKITRADARTPTPAQGFKPPTPRPPTSTVKPAIQTTSRLHLPTPFISSPAETLSNSIAPDLPANDLLPPYQEFVQHDTATTVGPPIYYEWKIPSNGLEPPKLDPPIGVDGREYPETAVDYNSISGSDSFVPSQNFGVDQQNSDGFQPIRSTSTTRAPTIRSVQADKVQRSNGIPSTEKSNDILQLRKEFLVPEYSFPLETIGRTGYLSTDTYNSFQLKIPERRSDSIDEHLHWFGENPKCPECHPSYVVPGTCEPCLRR